MHMAEKFEKPVGWLQHSTLVGWLQHSTLVGWLQQLLDGCNSYLMAVIADGWLLKLLGGCDNCWMAVTAAAEPVTGWLETAPGWP